MFRLEGAVDFILSIEECLQLHTHSPSISHNGKRVLAKEAMLLRLLLHDNIAGYVSCMYTSMHTCCHIHFVSVGSRGGRAGGYNEEGKCNNAVARGKLGDLLSIEHWQVSEECNLDRICCENNTENSLVKKQSYVICVQTRVYNCRVV